MKIKRLLKNTTIFAFGNIFSKLIIFLLLPLLTTFYSTSEFGTIDLFSILLSLLMPLIGFNTSQYLLREVSSNEEDSKHITKVVTSVLAFTLFFVVGLFFLTIVLFYFSGSYFILYLFIASTLQSIILVIKQLYRALEFNYTFVLSEILYTVIFGILIIGFISLNLNLNYYFIAIISAFSIELIYLLWRNSFLDYVDLKQFRISIIKKSISYSFPLMLNSLMWYIINISNRYFIIYFMSISASGIFAANMRLPTIIALIYSYLYKAVQILSFKYPKDNYNNLLNVVFALLILAISILTIFNDIVVNIMIGEEFRLISDLLPFMYLSALFSSYSSLLGINFQISAKTRLAFSTSVYAGLLSIVLNLILIPLFGLYGAVFSMLFSFIFMTILRVIKSKEGKIRLNHKKLALSNFLVVTLYLITNTLNISSVFLLTLTVLFLLIVYKQEILELKKEM